MFGASACLTVAIGFYESFLIVFAMGVILVFLTLHLIDADRRTTRVGRWLGYNAILCVLSLLFRAIINMLVIAIWHLEDQAAVLEETDLGAMLSNMLALFAGTGEHGGLGDVLADYYVKYFVHAVFYNPVLFLVLAEGIVVLLGLYFTIRKKDGWILLSVLGVLVLPFALTLVEGEATYYRTAQYVPLITAYAVLWAGALVAKCPRRWVHTCGLVVALIFLYRQGYEMNRWLYVDVCKDEYNKAYARGMADDICASCDATKPICVVGVHELPHTLISDAYVQHWSKRYTIGLALTRGIAEEAFAANDTENGYIAAQTPSLSFIDWASKAFVNYDRELVKYWNMLGYEFTEDGAHYNEASELMKDAPAWPAQGSVVEMETYIIVNLG